MLEVKGQRSMGEPDFFIIGAPKSGTTALTTYIGEHPNVHMAIPKEPHFFCKDMPRYRWVRQWDQYLKLFSSAGPGQLCGEASVFYLYSREAIHEIHAVYPHARLVAILRRPDEMVYSFYRQLRFNLQENQSEFHRAWELEPERRKGRSLPRRCRDPKVLFYRSIARYGEQLLRVLDVFPREQLKVVFYDDFARSTAEVYRDVLSFLKIEDDGKDFFPPVNVHKTHRSAALQFGLRWLFDQLHGARLYIEERTGADISKVRLHRPITNLLAAANLRTQRKPPLEEDLRKEIVSSYEEDILLLSQITGRDLRTWLQ